MRKKAIRSLTPLIAPAFTEDETEFYKWLAGFIDGDGYFIISQEGYVRLKIPQASWNLHLLQLLKEKLTGSIYKLKGNSYVYYLWARDKMIPVIHGLNGYIRGHSRTIQFKAMCEHYNIIYIKPKKLTPEDPYFAGMFDADGSAVLNNNVTPRLALNVASKYKVDLECFFETFGGNILSRKGEDCHSWTIGSQDQILFAQKCFGKKLKSNKLLRFNLISLLYELRTARAYKSSSYLHDDWNLFIESWYDNGADIYRKECKGIPYTKKAREKRGLENNLTSTNDDQT